MRTLLSILVLLCCFGCTRRDSGVSTIARAPIESDNGVESPSGSRTRILYAVADEGGVYLGDQKVGYDVAHDVIVRLLEKEKSSNLILLATDLARYGDFVRFYASFDQKRFRVATFPTQARPAGFRLPLFGSFRKRGCCWIDEENHEEFL